MKKSLQNVSLAVALLLATAPPTLAATQSTPAPVKATVASRLKSAPAALAGFCAGAALGMPICFVRYMGRETMNDAHGLIGSVMTDNNNPWLLVPAGIFCSPFAALVTAVETPVYACKNAYMADKPFSKEQFSLGTLEDPRNDQPW